MKRIIHFLIIVVVFAGASCKKEFETFPEERIFEKDIFDPTDKTGTDRKSVV